MVLCLPPLNPAQPGTALGTEGLIPSAHSPLRGLSILHLAVPQGDPKISQGSLDPVTGTQSSRNTCMHQGVHKAFGRTASHSVTFPMPALCPLPSPLPSHHCGLAPRGTH